MNPHILMVIDHQLNPDKYTQEQLDKNDKAAYAAYAAASASASADVDVDYWLRRYLKPLGENKQDYIDAINKENKQ